MLESLRLATEALRQRRNPSNLPFRTTAELGEALGQARALEALDCPVLLVR